MKFSYWEYQHFIGNPDFNIIGSGIVGLTTAIFLKKKHPSSEILILEKSPINGGGSTKNAGFSCFGSAGELLDDLSHMDQSEINNLLKLRWDGLKLLKSLVSPEQMDYQSSGSLELFGLGQPQRLEFITQNLDRLNNIVNETLGFKPYIPLNSTQIPFGLANFCGGISNTEEGSINTGKMISALIDRARSMGIKILNGVEVEHIEQLQNKVQIKTNHFNFHAKNCIVCTNAFAQQFFPEQDVRPARNLVMVTEPIKNLKLKAPCHMDDGYTYFRNIQNRILIGGSRHLKKDSEMTSEFGFDKDIKKYLLDILHHQIAKDKSVKIDFEWNGFLGVGQTKSILVGEHTDNVYYGVRMGGMGVAVGAKIGQRLADKF